MKTYGRQMRAETVLRILDTLERGSVFAVVDGGWGIDALLEEQTRPHRDLDLITYTKDGGRIREALGELGFQLVDPPLEEDPNPTNFVLKNDLAYEVDVHGVVADEGGAYFLLEDGRRWIFPEAALNARGQIAGKPVRCLSVNAQIQCHGQGYEPSDTELLDLARLQERFGVVLPLHLCRQTSTA